VFTCEAVQIPYRRDFRAKLTLDLKLDGLCLLISLNFELRGLLVRCGSDGNPPRW
jgi:hypothetical protein